MARRAGWIEHNAKPDAATVLLDGGDFSASPGNELRTEYLLRGMKEMGYDAIALGERDLDSGAEFVQDVARKLDVPFVSTNVFPTEGEPFGARSRIVEAHAGKRTVRVGVFAVADNPPGFFNPEAARTEAPDIAAQRVLDELRGKADLIVCLAHMTRQDADHLAKQVPGIDVVFAGHAPTARLEADVIGRTVIVEGASEGKQIRVVEWSIPPPGSSGGGYQQTFFVPLGDDVPTDDQMTMLVHEYESKMAGHGTEGPAEVAFVGPQPCERCHAAAVEVWRKSAHAHAYRTLADAGFSTPECLPCHTTGFRRPGGFVNEEASADLADVGCEGCHGPAANHILSRSPVAAQLRSRSAPVSEAQGRLAIPSERECRACHDAENDPDFDFASASAKIAHGKDAAAR